MIIALVALTFVCLFLLAGLVNVYAALKKSEREAQHEIAVLSERDNAWMAYADSLEAELATIEDRYEQLISIYKATSNTAMDNYRDMAAQMAKVASQTKANKSNGNGQKPQGSVSMPSDLTDKEQRMIAKWSKNNTPQEEMAKRIHNIRASQKRQQNKAQVTS